uniref:E3 ubiquitin-protein ligase RNF180 n=1 Tax=Culex pipiens TaxID=7175 RepID=A0A8D8BR16_CULPI
MLIKCRKCSNPLAAIDDAHVLAVHSRREFAADSLPACPTERDGAEVFLHEDHLPGWMNAEIEQTQWTRGKLKCTKCGQKVGSFDFVSGVRCKCPVGGSVLPAVHLVRSKVDVRKSVG